MELSESILNYYKEKQNHTDLEKRLGLLEGDVSQSKEVIREYINLKLLTLGHQPISDIESVIMTPGGSQARIETTVSQIASDLIEQLRAQPQALPPVDQRVQDFLNREFPSADLKIPGSTETFQIDRAGVAFELATPYNS